MNVIFEVIAVIITVLIGAVTYAKWAFTYWKRRGVPYIEPTFPFGNLENLFTAKEYLGVRYTSMQQYQEFKSKGHKHGGIYTFTCPLYMPTDPEYVRNVFSKDFQYFNDHGTYYNERDDPLSANLFNLSGQRWKTLRTKLAPTFTPGKIKLMFDTLLACTNQLVQYVNECSQRNEAIDMKDALECFTIDVIGSCAFGLECNSFKNPNSEFRVHGKRIFAATKQDCLKNLIAYSNNDLGRFLHITTVNSKVAKFFLNVVKDTVKFREETNFVRKDFMQILIDLNNNNVDKENGKDEKKTFTIEEIAAQVFIFFMAGYETSSTTMSFCLFELAMNPDIQGKLREEVLTTLQNHDQQITYDSLMEMKYMNQVIDEALRKYPPAFIIPRICVEDYQVPDTDVTIEKGTRVIIPALAIHRDPEFYPDPEKFDPERFSDENKRNIKPFTYVPFGEGPRMCIALRFGLMQTKLGLTVLLKNFKFTLNSRTKVPLVLNPYNIILQAKDGLWMNAEKL
ncbi:hypothetical protein ILUMI_07962 [Ignelater luminosus]|uniref:Cytochrome P450 n=1 Tax=Ignelater luminosus TaxID=2038154 RepID=A0A8K0GB42_IGNLU|nr:hypothetical protein ILUMI_07962 [Ignelater luminosus]